MSLDTLGAKAPGIRAARFGGRFVGGFATPKASRLTAVPLGRDALEESARREREVDFDPTRPNRQFFRRPSGNDLGSAPLDEPDIVSRTRVRASLQQNRPRRGGGSAGATLLSGVEQQTRLGSQI